MPGCKLGRRYNLDSSHLVHQSKLQTMQVAFLRSVTLPRSHSRHKRQAALHNGHSLTQQLSVSCKLWLRALRGTKPRLSASRGAFCWSEQMNCFTSRCWSAALPLASHPGPEAAIAQDSRSRTRAFEIVNGFGVLALWWLFLGAIRRLVEVGLGRSLHFETGEEVTRALLKR